MSTLFVDESKSRGYTMVAVPALPSETGNLRREVRSLVLPRQRRIHFTKEKPERRRLILSQLDALGIQAQVFHCATKDQVFGRDLLLTALVEHADEGSHTKIVLERDESLEKADRQILFREVTRRGLGGILGYVHEAPYQEPMLWVSDAVAWCYNKGGEWRKRANPLIAGVTILEP